MKYLNYTLVVLLLVSSKMIGQTTTENYVKTTTYQVKTLNGTTKSVDQSTLSNDDKIETITYFDGLGRLKQSIAKQAGGNRQDIVTPVVYDEFGRQVLDYQPYADPTQTTPSLDYLDPTALISNLETYYDNKFPDEWDVSDVVNPYSQKILEDSPLGRVLEQGAPGKDWLADKNSDADHTIKFDYQTNTIDDFVRQFNVTFPTGETSEPQLMGEGMYGANQLYKTVTKDENWTEGQQYPNDHTTEEFKDKQGRVVLKRTYNQNKWHDTYYVYDDYGNLTYVLPPKLATYGDFWQTEASSQYIYINANDLFETVVAPPNGSGGNIAFNSNSKTMRFSSYAYTYGNNSGMYITFKEGKILDLNLGVNLDGLILTGTMSANHQGSNISRNVTATIHGNELHLNSGFGTVIGTYYSFNISASLEGIDITIPDVTSTDLEALAYQYQYDSRNRLIEKKIPGKEKEYIVYDKLDRPVLTQDANLRATNHWLFTKYDVFGRVAYTGKMIVMDQDRESLQALVDTDTVLNETATTGVSYIQGWPVHYTNQSLSFPGAAINITELFTINYYDTYNTDLSTSFPNPNTVYGTDVSSNTKSLQTGSKVYVLDKSEWITTVNYYDDKGRVIYSGSKNDYLNTTDIIETDLDDFIGQVIQTTTTHTKDQTTIVTVDDYTYDHSGRLLGQKQTINDQDPEYIVKNNYDELGQLYSKHVGGKQENGQLQVVDYTYNIRGWLKQINDPNNLGDNDLFSFGINYNTPNGPTTSTYYNNPLYNGNISHVYWKTNNIDSDLRHYSYRYDALNRFTHSYYAQNDKYNNKFNTYVYGYDRNGNIQRLYRSMQNPGNPNSSTSMDYLTYTYDEGNKLLGVRDSYGLSTTGAEGFKDGNTTGDDYSYDDNGNMLRDYNKEINTDITYNHLNLPTKVEINNGSETGNIQYIYDASGIKLKKTVTNTPTSSITTTTYAGNYVYENDQLKFFNHPEGYVEPVIASGSAAISSFEYIYQYKDHLGNIRLSYKDMNHDNEITGFVTSRSTVFEDDFETASGWDGTGASWGHPITGFDSNFKYQGNYSGRIDRSSSSSVAVHSTQWISIDNEEDTEYIYSGWAYTNGPTIRLGMAMKEDGETGYLTMFDNTYGGNNFKKWVYLEKRVTVPAHIKSINLRIEANSGGWGNGSVWWDNVKIERVNTNAGESEIVEENNYYPFGLKHKGYNGNIVSEHPYKFNGKELNEELGLDWYDYGARNYDASLGRWMNIDNKAELYVGHSVYHYSANNPIYFKDVDGNYYVGADGKRVTTSIAKDGSIKLSSNASTDLKRMASLINKSGSSTAASQFNKVGNNSTKVHFKISQEIVRTKDGGVLLGLHQAHDKGGIALKWDTETGTFEGEVAFTTDSEGNPIYEEATITIFEKTIELLKGDKKESEMVTTKAHEDEHDLNKEDIKAIKQRSDCEGENCRNVENEAEKIEEKVRKEIKEKKN